MAADPAGRAGGPPAGSVEVTTRQTITATADGGSGMTLDEMAGFLRRVMIAGVDPATPLRVRATRKGAVTSVSVEGTATSG